MIKIIFDLDKCSDSTTVTMVLGELTKNYMLEYCFCNTRKHFVILRIFLKK